MSCVHCAHRAASGLPCHVKGWIPAPVSARRGRGCDTTVSTTAGELTMDIGQGVDPDFLPALLAPPQRRCARTSDAGVRGVEWNMKQVDDLASRSAAPASEVSGLRPARPGEALCDPPPATEPEPEPSSDGGMTAQRTEPSAWAFCRRAAPNELQHLPRRDRAYLCGRAAYALHHPRRRPFLATRRRRLSSFPAARLALARSATAITGEGAR